MYQERPSFGFSFPRLTIGVKWLLIANVVVFFVDAILGGALIRALGVTPANMFEGYGLGVLRLLSYQFVHAFGSISHIFWNMLLLYFFGTLVEEKLGIHRFLKLALAAGVAGAVVHSLLQWGSIKPLVGASGLVYGLLTYAAFVAPRSKVLVLIFWVELRFLVAFLILVALYFTILDFDGSSDPVAHGAHLGGALWGFIAFKTARQGFKPPAWNPFGRLRQWQGEQKARSQQQTQMVVDEILAKVSKHGLNSLTDAERRFLDKASKDLKR